MSWEDPRKSSNKAVVPVEIETGHILTTSQKCNRLWVLRDEEIVLLLFLSVVSRRREEYELKVYENRELS
jgi:hypothetical protein